jgi:hypothetical protein
LNIWWLLVVVAVDTMTVVAAVLVGIELHQALLYQLAPLLQ